MGKLLKHVGEDNVLWGTDSIWYGSPQDQIQAFRSFQIADEVARQARLSGDHAGDSRQGLRPQRAQIYPIPDEVLKKHLPQDKVALDREDYRERPDPTFLTHGPKTRREFLNLRAWSEA